MSTHAPLSSRPAFAAHLGFPDPANPLLAGFASIEPSRQIAFAAASGFAAVFDPFTRSRTPAEQTRIGQSAATAGLAMGSFLYAPLAEARRDHWTNPALDTAPLIAEIDQAIATAARLGSRDIVVIAGRAKNIEIDEQLATMATRLRLAADRVSSAGLTIHIEPVSQDRLPDMLLHCTADAASVVDTANRANVRLAFDTGHATANGEDPIAAFLEFFPLIGTLQLADAPGRVELGAGGIDFAAFLAAVDHADYRGLIELEHGWSSPSLARRRDYLERLGLNLRSQFPEND